MQPAIKKKYISNKINGFYKNRFIDEKINNGRQKKWIRKTCEGEFSKVYVCIVTRIAKTLKKYNVPLNMSYEKIIGCTEKELENYLFKKLKPGMTFENHGKWEVDHIIPISSFTFETNNDILTCYNYTNLQPLWAQENKLKSNKIIQLFENPSNVVSGVKEEVHIIN
jgi:hypothetical protein